VVSALGIALMSMNLADPADPSDPDKSAVVHVGSLLPTWFAIPLFLLVTLPLLWRRVDPMFAVQASFAGLLVNEALLGTEFVRCGVLLPTAFLLAFAAGAQLHRRDSRVALGFVAAMVAIEVSLELGPPVGAVMVGVTVAMWGIGRVVQSRRQLSVELQERTAELRDARDERARLEVASDRGRLAGELDELLQRRLGDLARLADRGATPADAAAATATLVDIERESRRTLEEMRAIVGVLRDDEGEPGVAPQPTLTHLEALLVRAKGSDARLTVDGNPRVLPPGVELSAYRIVEHLLDALEDSPDVEVGVRFDDDALELTVAGPTRRRRGAAIDRARERVQLHRGSLEATTRGGRSAAVVHLPVLVEA
jgi:signal transduction histidine kinase